MESKVSSQETQETINQIIMMCKVKKLTQEEFDQLLKPLTKDQKKALGELIMEKGFSLLENKASVLSSEEELEKSNFLKESKQTLIKCIWSFSQDKLKPEDQREMIDEIITILGHFVFNKEELSELLKPLTKKQKEQILNQSKEAGKAELTGLLTHILQKEEQKLQLVKALDQSAKQQEQTLNKN